MFGLGTLTLPADFARLGWILALLVMLLCLCGMLYCGRLFTLLAAKVTSTLRICLPLCEITHATFGKLTACVPMVVLTSL